MFEYIGLLWLEPTFRMFVQVSVPCILVLIAFTTIMINEE